MVNVNCMGVSMQQPGWKQTGAIRFWTLVVGPKQTLIFFFNNLMKMKRKDDLDSSAIGE